MMENVISRNLRVLFNVINATQFLSLYRGFSKSILFGHISPRRIVER